MPSACSSLQLWKFKIPYVMIFRAMLGNVLRVPGTPCTWTHLTPESLIRTVRDREYRPYRSDRTALTGLNRIAEAQPRQTDRH